MQPGLSTHVFLQQRLHPGLLDAILRGLAPYGNPVIEVFAARHHFEYTDRSVVRDLGLWFRDAGVQATLHQPLYLDSHWSRHSAPTLNLIDQEKVRRIEAMDEVKHALDSAEQIPFTSITLHLGVKGDPWNTQAIDNSLTAIEHVNAFARPLGVKVLLENLQNDVTTPDHLLEILNVGHFDNVGIALDLGHAHLAGGTAAIDEAIELLKPRLTTLHLHDNHGAVVRKDEHLWPSLPDAEPAFEGGIDWQNVSRHLATLPTKTSSILEITHELNETAESVTKKTAQAFDMVMRAIDAMSEKA
jgi:sugar phosphate isomerase/epimerase